MYRLRLKVSISSEWKSPHFEGNRQYSSSERSKTLFCCVFCRIPYPLSISHSASVSQWRELGRWDDSKRCSHICNLWDSFFASRSRIISFSRPVTKSTFESEGSKYIQPLSLRDRERPAAAPSVQGHYPEEEFEGFRWPLLKQFIFILSFPALELTLAYCQASAFIINSITYMRISIAARLKSSCFTTAQDRK
jgi:hypothetical protein